MASVVPAPVSNARGLQAWRASGFLSVSALDNNLARMHGRQPWFMSRKLAWIVVIAQMLWALAIPIKNVLVMETPVFVDDKEETFTTTSYPGYSATTSQLARMDGTQVLALLQQVLTLSVGDNSIRRKFEEDGDFSIDNLASIVPPIQHHLFAQYYGLVLQASEVMAGQFTVRQETLVVPNASSGVNTTITVSCDAAHAMLNGTRCFDTILHLPCDDSSFHDQVPKNTTLVTPVDLPAIVGDGTGWSNSLGLITFISFFHEIMRQVFAKQDWKTALIPYKAINLVYNPYELLTPFTQDGKLMMPDEDTFWANDGRFLQFGKTEFVSCAMTEVVFGYIYVRRFAIGMIQEALAKFQLYNSTGGWIENPVFIAERTKVIFSHNHSVQVTVGAGVINFTNDRRKLLATTMTQKASSSMLVKRDRAMQGAMLMGSSIRHIWHLTRYPNSFYSYMTPVVDDIRGIVNLEYRQIGALHAGFNGMKFDYTRNTMAVFKLDEQTRSDTLARSTSLFDLEQRFADWYRAYELQETDGLVAMVTKYLGPMPSVIPEKRTQCYQGLLRKIAQVAWVMALKHHPVMNHLVYTAMVDGSDPSGWTLKQMLVSALVVEDPYGFRQSIPYVRTSISPDTGSAWPMVPLLHAFILVYGEASVQEMFLTEMNSTYGVLVELEAGLTHFHDVVFCPIGQDLAGVTAEDSKDSMYDRIYPAIVQMTKELIRRVADIHQQMEQQVAPVQVRREFITYNHHHSIFTMEGSPVYWENSALAIGLIRLTTKEAPFPEDLIKFASSMVCYNTLEWRYLNRSSRCWNELHSISEMRIMRDSQGLRVIIFSTWSMGIVLNLIGAFVAVGYAWNLWYCWIQTGKRAFPMELALNLDIQSVGLLNWSRCAIMAFSVVPLIVTFHLPADTDFTVDKSPTSFWWSELIVALCMTWFVRLGMEMGRYFVHFEYFNLWFYIVTTRVRNFCILVTFLVRLAMPQTAGDFNRGIGKLVLSCVVSILTGFLAVVSSQWVRSRDSLFRDKLSRLLARAKFDRVWHGVLGQSPMGWSHAGLLFEGWSIVDFHGECVGLLHQKFLSTVAPDQTATIKIHKRAFHELTTIRPRNRSSIHLSAVGRRATATHTQGAQTNHEKDDDEDCSSKRFTPKPQVHPFYHTTGYK